MQEDDRVVTIGLAVAAGLTAAAVALTLYALTRAAPGEPPKPPPGFANLFGIITDDETGEPIAGVHGTVYQDKGTKTWDYDFTTNAWGYYVIKDMLVEVDVTQMVVYADGYKDYANEDIPIAEGNNELSFTMEAA